MEYYCKAITIDEQLCCKKITDEDSYCLGHQLCYPRKGELCSICHLNSRRTVVLDNCGHIFCYDCIYEWLCYGEGSKGDNTGNTCPYCRSDISEVQRKKSFEYGVIHGILTKVIHIQVIFKNLTKFEFDYLQSYSLFDKSYISKREWSLYKQEFLINDKLLNIFREKSRFKTGVSYLVTKNNTNIVDENYRIYSFYNSTT